ncbi:structural protein [Synechococcus phage S-B43]|nr:structural protein [Synechococcus phage S-B43]
MATNQKEFDSLGGFSVDQVSVVDQLRNAKDLNTLEVKNRFYSDSKTTKYILRGANTATLALDDVGTAIPIQDSTINFITGHFLAVNPAGVVYTGKIESSVLCNSSSAVDIQSSMLTIIKHDVPSGESWEIDTFSSANRFSYNVVRTGTTQIIKWVVSTEVVSIAWA